MSSHSYLVVGASRGIGLALVEQLSQKSGSHIYASVRKPTDFGKPNVETLILDQTDTESVKTAAAKVSKLDTLIVNAAIGDDERLVTTSEERLQQYLNTNVVGVHRVVNAFLPALKAGSAKQLVVITSMSGSNEIQKDAAFGFQGPYSVTKAANNMQVVQYHVELKKQGFTVIAMNPGWVATDMGNIAGEGAMPPAKSASSIVSVIDGLKPEDSAKFFDYTGETLPW